MTELKPYFEYKQSGVEWIGEVPIAWHVAPLLGCVVESRRKNKGLVEKNLLSLSYGRIVRKDIAASDGLLPESFDTYQIVEPKDIVLRLTDLQNDKRSLRSALVTQRGIITSAYLAISPRSINARYLAYYMRDTDSRKVFYSMGGGLRQSMQFADLKRLPVLVPEPPEQVAIADFLDRETAEIDAFIADQEELIRLLSERRAATISQAVTKGLDPTVPMKDSGVEWIGQVPDDWSVIRTRFLCDVSTGSGDTIDAVDDGDYPFYVRSDTPLSSDRYEFDGDAVLTAGDGAGVGKVFHLVAGKFAAHQRVYVLTRFRRVQADYFYYYFSLMFGKVALDGSAKSTVDSVRRPMITDLPVSVPNIGAQREIVRYLDTEITTIDQALADAREAIALSRERRAALISAAVTGKIDVREHAHSGVA